MAALLLSNHTSAAEEAGAWSPMPYQAGQGLYYPQQGLRIGGYANIHYNDLQEQPRNLNVQDLSLFLTQQVGTRWTLFTEMEVSNALIVTDDETTSDDAEFDIERLYIDYLATQHVTLRVGKFLTPLGQWNLIHADPLIWSVSRPLTTTAAYARHATGAMAYGSLPAGDNDLDYWLFADNSDALNSGEGEEVAFDTDGAADSVHNNFERGGGARLLYHLYDMGLSIGASYLDFTLQEPHTSYRMGGVDFNWSGQHLELSGEAIYREAQDSSQSDERGAFLQAVLHLPDKLHLVGRTERYTSSFLTESATINTLGITYRPLPSLALKLERRNGRDNDDLAPSGWLAAFSVLF